MDIDKKKAAFQSCLIKLKCSVVSLNLSVDMPNYYVIKIFV